MACRCVEKTASAWYAEAPIVVRGQVIATTLAKNPGLRDDLGSEVVRARIMPLEILKGAQTKAFEIIGSADYRNPVCTQSLLVGAEYVFLLWEDMAVSTCNSWFADGPTAQRFLSTFRRLKNQSK